MSFRPICNETKNAFFALFHMKHGPASAYYIYTEEIQLKYDNNKKVLADRAICPQKYDIYYFHKKFFDQSVGARNGKEMFSQLAKEVKEFNTNEQAGELIYMDTIASFDTLNTPLTLLFTSTPIRSLPLTAILTSDELAFTFIEALNILKCIMLLEAFNRCGPIIGSEVIMTDDCKLWDGKHKINMNDRIVLIGHIKKIVFARTEAKLEEDWCKEWAIAFCQQLPVHNNHTNNFAKARIQIIKDIIFD
ncbi:2606_t:CDS:2, partial [Gigaspora margarita]